MASSPIQTGSPPAALEIEVLEYGKFCARHDGAIEPLAEYRILGHSAGFPAEIVKMCTPQKLGLASHQAELERYQLLKVHDWGTAIRPVRSANGRYFYVGYRIGQRSEGAGRTYTVARYLCSKNLVNPLALYETMGPLEGLTREDAARITPIYRAWNGMPSDLSFSEQVVSRVQNGLRHGKPIFAVIEDEARFFRLAASVWEDLRPAQRRLFSCGWNVGPSIVGRVVMSFGPMISQKAARLDPGKQAPPAGKSAPTSAIEPYSSIEQLLDAGKKLSGAQRVVADPLEGFEDPEFAKEFSGCPWEEDLIRWMPRILEQSASNRLLLSRDRLDDVVSHLRRFPPALQQSLFSHLDTTILGDQNSLRAFASIERACREREPKKLDWGANNGAVLPLALRFVNAIDNSKLCELLNDLDPAQLMRSGFLSGSFLEAFSIALKSLTADQTLAIHRKLLATTPLPEWYGKWIFVNYSDLVPVLLLSRDAASIKRLCELLKDKSVVIVEIADRIVRGIGPSADENENVKKLGPYVRKGIASAIYCFWLEDEAAIFSWVRCFRDYLPASLLKHSMASWTGEEKQIREEVRKEFETQTPNARQRLTRYLASLCDSDDSLNDSFRDAFWAGYLKQDADAVHEATQQWTSLASLRFRLQRALFERDPKNAVRWLISAVQDANISSVPVEGVPAIGVVLNVLIGDPDLYDWLERLIQAFPELPQLRDWIKQNGLRTGAWLLQWENCPEGVLEKLIELCSERDAKILSGIRDLTPLTEDIGAAVSIDAAAAGWLATRIERQWGGRESGGWEIVVALARWTRAESYQDPVLRLLAGLSFNANTIIAQSQWQALASAQNSKILPDLALVKSLLTGAFEISTRPSDNDIKRAAAIVRQEPSLLGLAQWNELWKAAKLPWERLFVLETASHLGFEISIPEAAKLRTEPDWLKRTLSVRVIECSRAEPAGVPGETPPDPAETNARLSLADADFQSLAFDPARWTDELRDTPLVGAFRRVDRKYYSPKLFRKVVEYYHPTLEDRKCSGDIGPALLEFANAYGAGTEDHRAALEWIYSGFFQPHVCASLEFGHYLGTKPEVLEVLIRETIRAQRSGKKYKDKLGLWIEWVEKDGHFIELDLEGTRIWVDVRMKKLLESMCDFKEQKKKRR